MNTDPWTEQLCPVEGCRYEVTGDDGCGLSKLQTVQQAMAQWDAGVPVQRGCLASRRAEAFIVEHGGFR